MSTEKQENRQIFYLLVLNILCCFICDWLSYGYYRFFVMFVFHISAFLVNVNGVELKLTKIWWFVIFLSMVMHIELMNTIGNWLILSEQRAFYRPRVLELLTQWLKVKWCNDATDRAGVQPMTRPKPTHTDFGLQPYSHTARACRVYDFPPL